MHRLIAIFALAALAASPAAAERRNLSGFDEVKAEDRITVEIVVGPAYSVEVTGADADRVRTQVEGDRLEIRDNRRPWFGNPRLDAHVRVTMPGVEGLAAARGADMTATLDGASCIDLSAAAAMGATLRASGLECRNVDAAAAMGATLQLTGSCRALDAAAAMGGDISANELRCFTVDASAAMGGSVNAYASESYDAAASMGGDIDVEGGAAARETSSAMGGSITGRAP